MNISLFASSVRPPMKKKCEFCNNEFEVKPYRYEKARFCSIQCRAKIVMGCYKHWQGKKRDVTWGFSEEYKNELSKKYTGNGNPMFNKEPWNKDKKCEQLAGEKNGCWKGNDASYVAKHIWVKRQYGKANSCENKKCAGKSNNYHWANLSHQYKRIKSDWAMLCASCHSRYDRGVEICL